MDPNIGEAVYHCISRSVAQQWLFDPVAQEVFRRQLWLAAEFCGLQLITYTILSNHFHVTARVPRKAPVSDQELLRRHQLLNSRPGKRGRKNLSIIKSQLAANGPEAEKWRQSMLARMGDISAFMKIWKQNFTIWFNHAHGRIGTLWASRFTSVLIQPEGQAPEFVSAYVDLNAVRADMVRDPKDYRFCGYAEAVIGHRKAREGLMSLYRTLSWKQTQAHYRQTLFGIGAEARKGKASIRYEDFRQVIREKGLLPLSEVILCRLRHFVHGGILGTRAFVQEQIAAYEARTRKHPRIAPRSLPPCCEWGDLCTMRKVRESQAA
ncbi:MAG TPA: transposase [Candidatus Didemnitutus sp.]